MNRRIRQNRYLIIVFLAVVGLAVLTYMNHLYASNYPGGKYFQTQWIAARGVLSEGLSPYSENLLYKAQVSAYGRPAMAGEYEFRFMYPYFSLLIIAPFGLIKDYVFARACWMTFLEMSLIGIYFVSLNLADWKPKLLPGIFLFLISVSFYHNVRAVVDGNFLLILVFVLLLALVAIRDYRDENAGVLLAFTLVEIKFIFPVLILVFIYLIANRRFKAFWYFLGSVFLLAGFSFLLQPTWLTEYTQQLWLSISGNPFNSFISVIRNSWGATGARLSLVITIISALIIFFEWFYIKNATFKRFLWILFLTIAVIQFSGLPAEAANFVFLFPGFLFAVKLVLERWKTNGEVVVFMLNVGLYVATWMIFFLLREKLTLFFEPGVFFAILPLVEILLLYWSRWWVIRGRLKTSVSN